MCIYQLLCATSTRTKELDKFGLFDFRNSLFASDPSIPHVRKFQPPTFFLTIVSTTYEVSFTGLRSTQSRVRNSHYYCPKSGCFHSESGWS